MKKSLTFSFAMLLGAAVLLSPVSNALEADMSSSIAYRSEDTQICYVSEINEVISNTEIDKSVRQTVKERARTGATFYSMAPESQEQIEQLFGVHFVENALLDTMEHSIAQKDQMNVFFNSSTKVTETEYTRYWLDGNVSISLCANTFYDVDGMCGSQKTYTKTFPKQNYSISKKLYTSKSGKCFAIYTIQDHAGCTIAQYTMFQHHATDYALYVRNENAQKSETAGIPNDYLLTLLDSFSFEN
jgi:hypothetical protein